MNPPEPFLTDPKQIKAWLDSMGVEGWKINAQGLVDIEGSVFLIQKLGLLNRLPVKFGKVAGDFRSSENWLVSLEGAPKEVGGSFTCSDNQIVSLEWAPKKVGKIFACRSNQLVSLEGAPKEVGRDFYCAHNLLVDFKGLEGSSIKGDLFVTDHEIAGQDNAFVSLDGLPKALYGKVVGLDIPFVLELAKKQSVSLLGATVEEELSSEVELG